MVLRRLLITPASISSTTPSETISNGCPDPACPSATGAPRPGSRRSPAEACLRPGSGRRSSGQWPPPPGRSEAASAPGSGCHGDKAVDLRYMNVEFPRSRASALTCAMTSFARFTLSIVSPRTPQRTHAMLVRRRHLKQRHIQRHPGGKRAGNLIEKAGDKIAPAAGDALPGGTAQEKGSVVKMPLHSRLGIGPLPIQTM